MTARTRKVSAPAKKAPARKPAAKKAPAKQAPRKTAAKRTQPRLSLVKTETPASEAITRARDFITDAQIYATHAARQVGLPVHRMRDWRDHRDGTATRPLKDGSTLHYDHNTRTLTWQAVCRMGAIHQYTLNSPSMACASRLHADGCKELHADLSKVPALTPDELEALGLLQTPTWARPDLLGDDITETIPVPLPEHRDRALGDELTRSGKDVDSTQPMSQQDIAEGLAERAAADTAKEHPQP